MKAKKFYETYVQHMRPPTRRKILFAARKHGLIDTYSEVHWFLAGYLTSTDLRQVASDASV